MLAGFYYRTLNLHTQLILPPSWVKYAKLLDSHFENEFCDERMPGPDVGQSRPGILTSCSAPAIVFLVVAPALLNYSTGPLV